MISGADSAEGSNWLIAPNRRRLALTKLSNLQGRAILSWRLAVKVNDEEIYEKRYNVDDEMVSRLSLVFY